MKQTFLILNRAVRNLIKSTLITSVLGTSVLGTSAFVASSLSLVNVAQANNEEYFNDISYLGWQKTFLDIGYTDLSSTVMPKAGGSFEFEMKGGRVGATFFLYSRPENNSSFALNPYVSYEVAKLYDNKYLSCSEDGYSVYRKCQTERKQLVRTSNASVGLDVSWVNTFLYPLGFYIGMDVAKYIYEYQAFAYTPKIGFSYKSYVYSHILSLELGVKKFRASYWPGLQKALVEYNNPELMRELQNFSTKAFYLAIKLTF